MTSDAALRSDIEEELDFEPSLDATSIGIAVKEGVATWIGHVSTYAQKVAAERAVGRVKGIRAVAEEMIVRLPLDARHDDEDEIALRAASVLSWTLNVPDDTVHVKLEKGWVTLTGDIDWQYQRQSAELGVRRLGGVMAVSNKINIRPHATIKDARRISPRHSGVMPHSNRQASRSWSRAGRSLFPVGSKPCMSAAPLRTLHGGSPALQRWSIT